jgi:MCP family monocarboxylic acid transporter-like MFS transporter 10
MKGLATGFVACGASVAGVVYPTMLRYLIDSIGYDHAVQAVAGLIALTSVFSLIFATPNPEHKHRKPKSYLKLTTWVDPEAFRNPAFCWFTAAIAFLFFGFYPIFFNLEEVSTLSLRPYITVLTIRKWAAVNGYGTRNGSPAPMHFTTSSKAPLQTFWLLAILNGASTGGRVFMALCSDRLGPLNLHICVQTISSIFILVLWTLAGSQAAAIGFAVAFGITSGADIGLPPASMANVLAGTYNTPDTQHLAHAKLGQWVGMMYTIAAIPALTGPIIGGHLVTHFDTYIGVQMWSGACLLISALCMLVARWHLPCADGERVGTKLAHMWSSKSMFSEKGKEISDAETEYGATLTGFSRATTRVSSPVLSRRVSENKLNTEGREPMPATDENV